MLNAPGIALTCMSYQEHRGKETSGIAIGGGCQRRINVVKGLGGPADIVDPGVVGALGGSHVIGHGRYCTSGISSPLGAHPFHKGDIAFAHNGQINNTEELLGRLPRGTHLDFGSDTEIVAAMFAATQGDLFTRISTVCEQLQGAYTFALITDDGTIVVVRDPYGIRPASVGEWSYEDRRVVFAASETTAFTNPQIGATILDDVAPGEVMFIHPDLNVERRRFAAPCRRASCIFEMIYFAQPDSEFFGVPCFDFRVALGMETAREMGLEDDGNSIVVPVMKSGLCGGIGVSRQSGILYHPMLIARGDKRSFLQPGQGLRDLTVTGKHKAVRVKGGMRIIVVDDSVVRGTTGGPIADLVWSFGPSQVEMAIPCPQFRHKCVYGIDTRSGDELLSVRMGGDVSRMARELGVSRLHFLTMEGFFNVIRSFGWNPEDFCMACFNGDYPIPAG